MLRDRRLYKTTTPLLFMILALFLSVFISAGPALSEAAPALTLSAAEAVVDKGKTVKLTPAAENVANAKKLKYSWESSDTSVATVKNGTVKGVNAGSAVITCTTTLKDGTVLTAQAAVQVRVKVSALKLKTAKKLTMDASMTDQIEYTVSPDNATDPTLEWTSSDPTAVIVEDGYLTGIAAGKSTVTATTTDGSNKKIQVTVNVTGAAASADLYVKMVKATGSAGTYKITYKNMTDRVITKMSLAFLPYDENGQLIYLEDDLRNEPRFYVYENIRIEPGKEVSASHDYAGFSGRKVSDVRFALRMVVFEDAPETEILNPWSSMYWYSAENKAYLGAPVFQTGCLLTPELIAAGNAHWPGFLTDDRTLNHFDAPHYGYHFDGLVVREVTPDSVAARAGLQTGDLIIAVDDRMIGEDDFAHLRGWIALGEGRSVKVTVERPEAGTLDLLFEP